MRKIVFTSLVFSFLSLSIFAQTSSLRKPKLVVFISVEGLEDEHVATLWNSFGNNGFKRLIGGGTYIPKANCNYLTASKITDYATLFTGTVPYYHGITGEKYYNLLEKEAISIIYDSRYRGIATKKTISPTHLIASTIADELWLSKAGQSKIVSLAINAEAAMMMGGHLAQAAVWLDNENGTLCTTNFYEKGLPSWAEKMNIDHTISNYLQQKWTPKQAIENYIFKPCTKKNFNNKWVFFDSDDYTTFSQQMEFFKQSPAVNSLIEKLAIKALREEKMGNDDITDLLCLQFTVNTPFGSNKTMCLEQEDIYLRLDKELNYLLDAIDISVGMEHTVVVLTTVQEEVKKLQMDDQIGKKMPYGQFNANRSMALLNAYLMAIYGQGQWISDYYNCNIYLNQALIESKKIKKQEMETYAAQFLTEFEGVQAVFTSNQIQNTASGVMMKIRNGYHKNVSGDIVFTLHPGWAEVNLTQKTTKQQSQIQTNIPVSFYGFGIKQQEISEPVNMEDIAPTLSDLLRIDYPNGCIGSPILKITTEKR